MRAQEGAQGMQVWEGAQSVQVWEGGRGAGWAQVGKGCLLPKGVPLGVPMQEGCVGKDQELGTPTLSDWGKLHGLGHAIPIRAWESLGPVTLYSQAHCTRCLSRDRAGNVGRLAQPLSPV